MNLCYIRKTGIYFGQLLNVFFSFFVLSAFVPLNFLEEKKIQGREAGKGIQVQTSKG